MAFETDIIVRYAETDQMKVVYYANYFIWMEQARTEFLDSLGLPYHELETQGYFLPVTEACLKYIQPARYGDKIKIETAFSCKGIRVKAEYKICRNKQIIAEGYTSHVFANEQGKPIRPPKKLVDFLNKI